MTPQQIAETLPNGFHDALVHRCEWDLEQKTAVVEISIWTGDLHDQSTADRERHERRRLIFQGVRFLHIESPAPSYPYAKAGPIRVELCEPDREHPLMREQPAGTFGARFFVEEWNSFIHLVAEEADLVPLPTSRA